VRARAHERLSGLVMACRDLVVIKWCVEALPSGWLGAAGFLLLALVAKVSSPYEFTMVHYELTMVHYEFTMVHYEFTMVHYGFKGGLLWVYYGPCVEALPSGWLGAAGFLLLALVAKVPSNPQPHSRQP